MTIWKSRPKVSVAKYGSRHRYSPALRQRHQRPRHIHVEGLLNGEGAGKTSGDEQELGVLVLDSLVLGVHSRGVRELTAVNASKSRGYRR
jgi:hypothetical protein